jgi:hypothetical protein
VNEDDKCEMRREQLLRMLSRVFANSGSPPIGDEVSLGSVRLGHEYQYSQDFFSGKEWELIEDGALLRKYPSGASAAVTFLSDKAFCYFLPAFIRCVLRSFNDSEEYQLLSSILFDLTPGISDAEQHAFLSRIEHLSLAQRAIVAEFIQYLMCCHQDSMVSHRVADLKSFWLKYSVAKG